MRRNGMHRVCGVAALACALAAGCAGEKRTQTSEPKQTKSKASSTKPVTKATPAPAPAPSSSPTKPPAPNEPQRVAYGPHVTIDWSVPQVEIDAKVVFREGPLELLLCSVGTKEHESILATPAKPRKVFEALGLIGIEPGHPPAYDLEKQAPISADGQRVMIEILSQEMGGTRTSAAHQWMKLTGGGPMPAPRWVFCGSRTNPDGRFAADGDGTIVCVVDFDTAVVGLGESHTASNAALWLEANTGAIPAMGTACTVVIRALDERPMEITLTPKSLFQWGDKVLMAEELDKVIRQRTLHNPDQKLILTEAPGEPNPLARLAARAIIGSGIKPENLTANLLPRPEPTPQPPPNASPADPDE